MKGQKAQKGTLKKVLHYIRPYWALVGLSVLLAAVTVAASLYIPILTGNAVDYIVGPGNVDFPGILRILVEIGLVIAVAALSQWVMSLINNRITYRVVRDIRNKAFQKIQILPLKYLDGHPTGEVVSRVIADVDQFADGLLMGFTQLFSGVLTIVGTLVFMLSVNVVITAVVVVITPVSLVVAAFIAKRTYDMFRLQSQVRGEQTGFVEEMVQGQKVVQAFGRERDSLEKFDEINERLRKCSLRAIFFSSITNPSTRFVNSLVYTGVGIVGALSVIGGGLSVGQLSAFLSYANQYTKPFNEISGVVTELQNALACAGRVFELIEERPQVPDAPGARVLENARGSVSIQDVAFSYRPEQPLLEDFHLEVKPGQRVALVGPTGCGKTTVINCIIRLMQGAGLTVSLAAPTGRAAKRMTEATGQEAKTIHRLLEYAAGEEDDAPLFGKTEEDPLKADVVIVDEMSMVDLLLMRSLLKAVRPGTRLVLVGDADQLPSVGAGNVLRDILDSRVLPVARLTEVFRQAAQSHIVVNAHRINSGQMPIIQNRDTDFFFEKKENLTAIAQSVCALVTRRLPGYYHIDPVRDIQVLAPMKKGEAGVFALNRMLQEQLNPPSRHKKERLSGETRFREGDKVMQVRNNYQAEWTRGDMEREEGIGIYNGDIGVIESIGDDGVLVYFDDDRRVTYDEAMLQDLELAYAMTIHKSQGSEFPTVVLALLPGPPQMMVRNLLYTAVTRAKQRVVMVGSEGVLRRMVENDKTAHRYSALGERLQALDRLRAIGEGEP